MEDLFGYDCVSASVERVKQAYKFSQSLGLGKLYVCFSGGKDSVAVYGICKKAFGDKLLECCDFEYNVTNVDQPDLVYFIRKEYPFVHFNMPDHTMWELIVKNGMPPTQLARYCCRELKERGGYGRFCLTGVRWAESTRRKNTRGTWEDFGAKKADSRILNADNDDDRRELEHCIPKRKYICNPIVDWEDSDVWAFIRQENIPYCSLYDKGWNRLGCIACPMATKAERIRQLEENPKIRDQYLRTFQKMLDKRAEKGLKLNWANPQEVMEWWLR